MSFKICIIGCGGMSTGAHGPALAKYASTHPDTELTACCDLNHEKAVCCRDRFGFARSYTDLADMLNREKPGAVCLVAPVNLTCELSCRIMEMGYPLIMEKPPGMTVAETDRMIAVAERTGAPHQVAFNRRHAPLVRKLRQILADTLGAAGIHYLRYEFVRVDRRDADFSTTAIHGIDTARFLAGSDYKSVRFHYQPLSELGPAVANITMECEFVSGTVAHLNFCPVAGVVIERVIVHAKDHTFVLNMSMWLAVDVPAFDAPGRLQHIEKGVLRLDVTGDQVTDGPGSFEQGGFYAENAAFFDDIRAGRHPAGNLKNARQSVELTQFMRERRPVYPG